MLLGICDALQAVVVLNVSIPLKLLKKMIRPTLPIRPKTLLLPQTLTPSQRPLIPQRPTIPTVNRPVGPPPSGYLPPLLKYKEGWDADKIAEEFINNNNEDTISKFYLYLLKIISNAYTKCGEGEYPIKYKLPYQHTPNIQLTEWVLNNWGNFDALTTILRKCGGVISNNPYKDKEIYTHYNPILKGTLIPIWNTCKICVKMA